MSTCLSPSDRTACAAARAGIWASVPPRYPFRDPPSQQIIVQYMARQNQMTPPGQAAAGSEGNFLPGPERPLSHVAFFPPVRYNISCLFGKEEDSHGGEAGPAPPAGGRSGQRQRQDHRDLRPAPGLSAPGAGPLRLQVRAGLYRPHVPPGGAGPAQPEPGPVFQRGGPGPRPAVLRRAWPRRGGAGGGHGLLRRRGGHGAGQQLAPGPGHRDPHPAGGAPPRGGPHSGGHGAGAGPVPQSRYDRRASSQWLLPGAGGTAHAHAPKGDGPSGAGLAAPAARLRHRKPAPGPAHAGGGPGAGRQGGPAGQPAGGDGGSGGRPGPGPVRRPSAGGALRHPAGAGGPCGGGGPGPGLLLLL